MTAVKHFSVRQFIACTAADLGMQVGLEGAGVNEDGYAGGKAIIRINLRYFPSIEVETLPGELTKTKQKPGWVPEITAQEMCAEMLSYDLVQAKQHALLIANGYSVNVSVG